MIKLVVCDVDGVLTDGRKTYNDRGVVTHKTFYDKDFDSIKQIMSTGVNVVWLSGDRRVNQIMAFNRDIPFYSSRKKEEYLPYLCKEYDCLPKEVLFVGDSIHDLGLMKLIGHAICPANANRDVLMYCEYNGKVSDIEGGYGIMEDIYCYVHSVNGGDLYG